MPLLRSRIGARSTAVCLSELSHAAKTRSSILTLINCEPAFRFYRSLRAVKVLLAALCSTLTLLAPRRKRSLSVVLGQQGCSSWVSFEASNLALMVASKTVSLSAAIRLSCSRWASP